MEHEALPDILAMFLKFDETYFDGQLKKDCYVEWSSRMFVCAGICSHGSGDTFCTIRLSKPLLKLRPRTDLVETLLHEMIHAFLGDDAD
ncbi:unnamed protein product [Caenorhabditis angaria]|uniref:SprT-like domain-containing protein n=1 Tax=Caenorhabditis angaria TaxID=860376 RepID=A0A9P1N8W2_9PELO|nr:unnamed protein product [Caenorhabditis angaria]